jgi:hypothetical protein
MLGESEVLIVKTIRISGKVGVALLRFNRRHVELDDQVLVALFVKDRAVVMVISERAFATVNHLDGLGQEGVTVVRVQIRIARIHNRDALGEKCLRDDSLVTLRGHRSLKLVKHTVGFVELKQTRRGSVFRHCEMMFL